VRKRRAFSLKGVIAKEALRAATSDLAREWLLVGSGTFRSGDGPKEVGEEEHGNHAGACKSDEEEHSENAGSEIQKEVHVPWSVLLGCSQEGSGAECFRA